MIDCFVWCPLGMETGVITERQIWSSSFVNYHWKIRGRLGAFRGWCPRSDDDEKLFLVDFNQPEMVSGIGITGVSSKTNMETYIANYGSEISDLRRNNHHEVSII